LVPAYRIDARNLPANLTLREEAAADRGFLFDLYASTRAAEVDLLPWTDSQRRAFLQQQFDLQWAHYRQHYPNAEWLIIEHAGRVIGRLYLETTGVELRLMDIALVPASRNQGLGTALTLSIIDHAARLTLPVSLHVEPFNPAAGLYQRLGFQAREMRGIYCYMERPLQLNVTS
jgi:ribosomal protein S18 acetylase RimI-like enzyme